MGTDDKYYGERPGKKGSSWQPEWLISQFKNFWAAAAAAWSKGDQNIFMLNVAEATPRYD